MNPNRISKLSISSAAAGGLHHSSANGKVPATLARNYYPLASSKQVASSFSTCQTTYSHNGNKNNRSLSTKTSGTSKGASSFSVVPMHASEQKERRGPRRGTRANPTDSQRKHLDHRKARDEEHQREMNRQPTTELKQQRYSSGLLKPRLPQDLEDELTFDEFMHKVIKDNDFETMYRKIYGREASTDEEYHRFKDVMQADPLSDDLPDFRKDDMIDIVELTRDQFLEYRQKRSELKKAYAKHGYERVKIFSHPNRKGLYEMHLFKREKPLDKQQIFAMNRIKYQLKNELGLSSEDVDELKKLKKEHDDKKLKRIQEEMEGRQLRSDLKREEREKKEKQKSVPLMDRFKQSLEKMANEELELRGKRAAKKAESPLKKQTVRDVQVGKSSTSTLHSGDVVSDTNPSVADASVTHNDSQSLPERESVNRSPSTDLSASTEEAMDQHNTSPLSVEDSQAPDDTTLNPEIVTSPARENESADQSTEVNFEDLSMEEQMEHYYNLSMQQQADEEDVDIIRGLLSDDSKLHRLSQELDVPAALLKKIYFEGGLEETMDEEHELSMQQQEGEESTAEQDPLDKDLTDKEVSALAKELAGKTKFDINLTKQVLSQSLPNKNHELKQKDKKSKPVLEYVYNTELDRYSDMTPEQRLVDMREDVAVVTKGQISLPYDVYRSVKALIRSIPKDELFRAAKIVSTVMRVRMGGFGRKYEAAAINSRVDPDDFEGEQKQVIQRIKSFSHTLDQNQKGEFSQAELAELNVKEKQNLKFSYHKNESIAYIALKLPGFHAVNSRIMTEVASRLPDWKPQSHLDFGAGPGTSILAANKVWKNSINDIIAIEPSSANMENALELTKDIKAPIAWRRYLTEHFRRKYDLVTASYVLNEITDKEARMQTLETLWSATGGVLVLIDSGTPLGFNIIREAREFILSKKDAEEASPDDPTVLAPCPHDSICPMAGTRWCHFQQRAERPDFLRQIKNRALLKKGTKLARSYEDEDFSYVVFRKKSLTGLAPIEQVKKRENARLERLKANGKLDKEKERMRMELLLYKRKLSREAHSWPRLIAGSKYLVRKVAMNFCTPQGALAFNEIYPKSMGRNNGYRLARRAKRGDLFSFPRRIMDPNKPSSRELYLSKMKNKVRTERQEVKEMHRMIEEYGLIPDRETRIQEAQERWKKIKQHWSNPLEKTSFMAPDLQQNAPKQKPKEQSAPPTAAAAQQETPEVVESKEAAEALFKRRMAKTPVLPKPGRREGGKKFTKRRSSAKRDRL